MTRINIIPVEELHDQHLIAEHREIDMVPTALKGHVYFFYNKGKYLDKRYHQIIKEMKHRGFTPDSNQKFPKDIFIENNLYKDWLPNLEDLIITRERIKNKINQKPNWYRKTST